MLLPKIRRPEAMSNAFAALGEALKMAGEDDSLRQPLIDLLCVRFSDIFYWHAGSCSILMAAKKPCSIS